MNFDDLVAIDFETYYADDYSLRLQRYNLSEYVRDERFLIHGVGIQHNGHKPYWVTGHKAAIKELRQLGLNTKAVVAHHMAFDGFILHEHCDIHPAFYCDTLSMARAAIGHHTGHSLDEVAKILNLGAKLQGLEDTKNLKVLPQPVLDRLRTYCLRDTELCAQIFWILKRYIPDDELRLIDITLRMFCTPRFLVDEELVYTEYQRQQALKRLAVQDANTEQSILASNEQFADLLRELGVEPPVKISPRTGKITYAFAKTDDGFRKLLASKDDAVRVIAEARLKTKSTINETRAYRLFVAGRHGQPLPVLLLYAGAHTLRWSGGNKLNLQNFPRAGVLRQSIMAPDDHQILVFDLSQIEARLTALFCGEHDLVAAFAALDAGTGADVYRTMASKIYGIAEQDVTSDQRFIGKVCVLGMGYGMGWKRLKITLRMGFMGKPVIVDEPFARRVVNIYRRVNSNIVAMWERLNIMLERMATDKNLNYSIGPVTFKYKMVTLPNGLALKYPGLALEERGVSYLSRNGKTYIWGGMLLENIVQALARCVIAEQILQISPKYFVGTMTHDEVVMVVPNQEIETAYKEVKQIMTTPPTWAPALPLAVEGGWDVRYSK